MGDVSRVSPGKVPEITCVFWIVKIAATTLGETAGDAVSMSMHAGYLLGSGIFALIYMLAVWIQIRAKRFYPAVYWTAMMASTTVGTTVADYADRSVGLGYAGGVACLFMLLLAALATWYWLEGNIAVTSATSFRAEIFYWITIMFSQTLGTALGDWVADTAGIGYLSGAVLFAGLFGLAIAARRWTHLSPILLFWWAFILSRPLGAVLGDWLDKPFTAGGLGFSRAGVSALLLMFIAGVLWRFPPRAALLPATAAGEV